MSNRVQSLTSLFDRKDVAVGVDGLDFIVLTFTLSLPCTDIVEETEMETSQVADLLSFFRERCWWNISRLSRQEGFLDSKIDPRNKTQS